MSHIRTVDDERNAMTSTWLNFMGSQIRYGGNRYQGRYVEAGQGEPIIFLHGQRRASF